MRVAMTAGAGERPAIRRPDHACGLSTIRSNENAESARN